MDDASPNPPSPDRPTGRATLVRGRHLWRVECGLGDGPALGRVLGELAARPDCPLDRFDAALIGLQIASMLASGLDKLVGEAAR